MLSCCSQPIKDTAHPVVRRFVTFNDKLAEVQQATSLAVSNLNEGGSLASILDVAAAKCFGEMAVHSLMLQNLPSGKVRESCLNPCCT